MSCCSQDTGQRSVGVNEVFFHLSLTFASIVMHEARSPSALIGYIGSPNPAHFPEGFDVLARIALLAIAAPRWIIAFAILLAVGETVFGIPVVKSLSAGGFQDPPSPSAHAAQVLADKLRHSDQQLLIL